MAHIRKLEGSRWQARYRNPDDRREVARNFATKRAAQDWLADVTASFVRNDYADPRAGKMMVGELAAIWFAATAPLKPSTRHSYRGLLRKHVLPRWSDVELRKVTTSGIATWVAEMSADRSASTVRKALGVLRGVLDLAVADRRLSINPALGVAQPRLPLQEMRFLDATDLERLADEMPTERDRVLTMLLGWTGLRAGEALALRREDVDVLRRRVRIARAVVEVSGELFVGSPKSHQARTVALPTFLAEMVAASMPTDGLLFPNRVGEYLYETNWKRRVFDPAAKRATLTPTPLRVHDLRHTAASFAIASGASVKAVQRQLGHRSATLTLDRYAHLWPDELDALGDGLERLRTPAPADSLRTPETDATVIPLETRR
jgi:integrase